MIHDMCVSPDSLEQMSTICHFIQLLKADLSSITPITSGPQPNRTIETPPQPINRLFLNYSLQVAKLSPFCHISVIFFSRAKAVEETLRLFIVLD
ncbi:uncharacterized protein YALI1_A16950g [Yarrowia lipolytica]|uniref:Uncharacterized protein n=1 Tax=Yarrowia lipolytica TaxID=4952 RepID=A0A1D8N548_YARLL|nr:hypothetical protein YALI1_A16950g [Yarrowia lipolytica]